MTFRVSFVVFQTEKPTQYFCFFNYVVHKSKVSLRASLIKARCAAFVIIVVAATYRWNLDSVGANMLPVIRNILGLFGVVAGVSKYAAGIAFALKTQLLTTQIE